MQPFFLPTAIIIFDQVTKILVEKAIPIGISVPIIKGLIQISRIYNPGSALGILTTAKIPIITSVIILIAWLILIRKRAYERLDKSLRLGVGLIIGGTAGNLIDRIRLGFVIDFIDLHIWPIFNLADVAVCAGAVILVYSLIIRNPEGGSGE
ncbi:MAG: signal peptidase II [Firmicutes bacterium]|nr:signal peptidase II [Bacillota bacterium]